MLHVEKKCVETCVNLASREGSKQQKFIESTPPRYASSCRIRITMGGQLAAQALANAAAVLVFWFALKLKLVSYIPTALRIGAGYGVAVLVGVLGMRNLGLLVADSFVLSTITWESVSKVFYLDFFVDDN